ncbi:MAG: hypothetical protein IKN72_10955 [Clostridia bacterium]|nr:hypothetical protein [Clostridia bacterium]MBR3553888.1 hypothetical protein [Clostridia bacterium]
MIKGVNHQVVEVNDTQCPYFERILFFVNPEYAAVSEGKLRERAGQIAARASGVPPTRVRRTHVKEIALALAAAAVGALLTVLLTLR